MTYGVLVLPTQFPTGLTMVSGSSQITQVLVRLDLYIARPPGPLVMLGSSVNL